LTDLGKIVRVRRQPREEGFVTMNKLVLSALGMGLLAMAACGGGEGDRVDTLIVHTDAGADGGGLACNVAVNSGCPVGEKCTWVRVSVGPNPEQQLGQVACVPEGNVPTDGACMYGMSGIQTGYDDCVGGDICLAPRTAEQSTGVCREICSLLDTSNPCDANFACGAYQKYFTNGGMNEMTLAGLCSATCDPLTQRRDSDDLPACGSTTPEDSTDAGSEACYGLPSRSTQPSSFRCAGIIDMDPNMPGIQNENTHRIAPAQLCLNCCAPGFVPLYIDNDTSQVTVCFATCKPADTNNTMPANAGGDLLAGEDENGDPSPGAWTCPNRGATGATEECRYMWFFEEFFNNFDHRVPISANSDNFGFCWDYTQYMTTSGSAWTSCTETIRSSDDTDPTGDVYWGCVNSSLRPPQATSTPTPRSEIPTFKPYYTPEMFDFTQ
jgi:hypothetical protein